MTRGQGNAHTVKLSTNIASARRASTSKERMQPRVCTCARECRCDIPLKLRQNVSTTGSGSSGSSNSSGGGNDSYEYSGNYLPPYQTVDMLQLPEIDILVRRLVDANLGFTQLTVTDVLTKEDCWNATSFIHALRAREAGRKCDMMESQRVGIDAPMDMVIVDIAVTLINEFGCPRNDVLDAIATFRCHNLED
eukprot:gene37439-46187_t